MAGSQSCRTTRRSDRFSAPKVDGLRVLVRLLGDAKLDFVALMSSISSVIGSPGTCGYAAANAVFDSFVESSTRPEPWKHVVAINWGAWREIGMAANLVVPERMREEREMFLRTAIETEAGVDAFASILAIRPPPRRHDIRRSRITLRAGGPHAGNFLAARGSKRAGAFERTGAVVIGGRKRWSQSAGYRY